MEGNHGIVGYRFHPNEEEIITYYLERKMCGLDFPVRTIEDVIDVCMYEPWELPQRSPMPKEDRVWYFFNAPVSKYAKSKRVNRTTNSGFWKVTGRDRVIWDRQGKEIGFKKNLVYHEGRVPHGIRTNWVIHEYHSHKSASYLKEYFLIRLKRKSGHNPDTCNELSPHLASDSGNHATGNTDPQINPPDLFDEFLLDNNTLDFNVLKELLFPSPEQETSCSNGLDDTPLSAVRSKFQPQQGTSYSDGFDHNDLSSLLSMVQQEQGTSNSDGFNNKRSLLNDSFLETSEQEDAFVNSLWVDQGEFSGEINTITSLHGFNPTKPLRGVYVGDSSDTDTEMVYHQCQTMQAQGLGYESSSSSNNDAIVESDISSVISDADLPGTFCLERVVDELPTNTRIYKNQHIPKNPKYFEAQCRTKELQMQSKVSHTAVSNFEAGEAAKQVVDLPRNKKMVNTSASASSKTSTSSNGSGSSNTKKIVISGTMSGSSSNGAGSSNIKAFISWETPQLNHKTNPPSVYLLNALVSLVLIIFFIGEMAYLH